MNELLIEQIIQNWCLVHYYTLTGRETIQKHWKKDELQTHIMKCASYDSDVKNTIEERTKALLKIWNERDFATNANSINLVINTKFRKEKINTNSPDYMQCINDCMLHASQIISVIANANSNEIIKYTNSI